MKEAKLYKKNDDGSVDCFLCRHACHVVDGARGICMVRENKGGVLFSLFYGKPTAIAIDPIEKKPLFHFLPGTESLSIATVGCNFQCPFCQNWDISQYGRTDSERGHSYEASPQMIADQAHEAGCKTIAYTYSEPTVFFEYSYDIAKAAEKYNIKNVYVTNGFMTRKMLDEFHPLLHAANIDLKSFNPKTYKTVMRGDLNGVLDSIQYMKELGIWIEITTLVVTGMNDSKEELKEIAEFIASVGVDIPWHISKFHPTYKYTDQDATSLKTLQMAYNLGKEAGLRYVYMGNVPTKDGETTFCYSCGEELIKRIGFGVEENKIGKDSKCPKCNVKIDGVFN
jgi:pyruvate formate lyase activating enzyme